MSAGSILVPSSKLVVCLSKICVIAARLLVLGTVTPLQWGRCDVLFWQVNLAIERRTSHCGALAVWHRHTQQDYMTSCSAQAENTAKNSKNMRCRGAEVQRGRMSSDANLELTTDLGETIGWATRCHSLRAWFTWIRSGKYRRKGVGGRGHLGHWLLPTCA
jgi:hypothetical protein